MPAEPQNSGRVSPGPAQITPETHQKSPESPQGTTTPERLDTSLEEPKTPSKPLPAEKSLSFRRPQPPEGHSTPAQDVIAIFFPHLTDPNRINSPDEIRPFIFEDLREQGFCKDLTGFFKYLLRIISSDDGDHLEDLMTTHILPLITNPTSTQKDVLAQVNDQLKKDGTKVKETARYPPFVKAANEILSVLNNVDHASFRPAGVNDEELFFKTQDPKLIKGEMDNGRKPDIITALRKDLKKIYNEERDGDWLEFLANPPQDTMKWEDILQCWEFKASKAAQVPKNAEKYNFVEPNPVGCDTFATIEDEHNATTPVPTEDSATTARRTSDRSGFSSRAPVDTPSVGMKRSAHDAGLESNPAIKTRKTSSSKSPAVQAADYAAEMFVKQWGRAYIMNFVIKDNLLQMWYYDKQSVIQVVSFNFLNNLPYFYLLLFIIQRSSCEHMGYLPIHKGQTAVLPDRREVIVEDLLNEKNLFRRYRLRCRTTQVIFGKLGAKDVAVKPSYPEESRSNGPELIRDARQACAAFPVPLQCLPEVIDDVHFDGYSTRHAFPKLATRIPRLIIMPRYGKLTDITPNTNEGSDDKVRTEQWGNFMRTFWKLIHCHATLWWKGIEHGDINIDNLLYDKVANTPKLCDFDLSHKRGEQRPAGFVHTGTWRFMAAELLTEDAMNGHKPRLYRHDLESFGWVLLWILCRFHDGKEYEMDLKDWQRETQYRALSKAREEFLDGIYSGSFKPRWPLPPSLLQDAWFFLLCVSINHNALEELKYHRDSQAPAAEWDWQHFKLLADALGLPVFLDWAVKNHAEHFRMIIQSVKP